MAPEVADNVGRPHVATSGYALSPADRTPIFFRRTPCPTGDSDTSNRGRHAALLTDGIGCDGYVWKYLRRDLAGVLELVHWHYPGHGRSPEPRDRSRVGIPDLADNAIAVLDECQLDRAVLFGHSMGVQVVLEAYRRHPDRVSGLVLLCGMAENPLATFRGTSAFEALLPKLRALVERAPFLFNTMSRLLTPTKLMFALAARLEVNAELLDPGDFMPYLRGLSLVDVTLFLTMLAGATEHSAADLLGSIEVPVLVVGGALDGFTPPELSEQMANAISGSELLIVEDGSHTAPIERPKLVDGTVEDFLSRRVFADAPDVGQTPTLT